MSVLVSRSGCLDFGVCDSCERDMRFISRRSNRQPRSCAGSWRSTTSSPVMYRLAMLLNQSFLEQIAAH